MRRFFRLLVLWLPVVVGNAFAGVTGSLSGRVTEAGSGQPLTGANVVLVGTHMGAATDSQGRFHIYNVPAGVYAVRTAMMGYRSSLVRNVRIIMDLKTTHNIALEATVLEMDEVVVTAEKPLIQPDVTGSVHSVKGSRMEEMPVDNFRDVMALQPGVTADGHIRGGRETEVLYLVDGLPIQDAVTGGQASDLPIGSIIEMTVHTGGFNAEYGNAMSGVVNVVTKSGSDRHLHWLRVYDDRIGHKESNRTREYELFGSGPILKDRATYFFSANLRLTDTRWWQDMVPVFGSPIERNINLVGKATWSSSPALRLNVQGLLSDWDWHEYEFRWRKNLTGLPPLAKRSYRLSATLTHTPSPRVFYTLSLSRHRIDRHLGKGSKEDVDPTQGYQYDVPYYWFIIGGDRLWWQDARQIVHIAKGDLTAQLGWISQLKAGFEFTQYDLFNDLVKYEPQKTFWGKPLIDRPLLNFSTRYSYKPRQFSAYLQNKMDNNLFVANVGVRYDLLDPRAQRPVVEWIPITQQEYRQEVREWVPASLKHQISPRIGISFPAGERGHFFVNFGYFFQVPLFDYMYTGLNFDLKKGIRALVGNPDLKPERTQAYELSYKREFGSDVLGSITVFHKDVKGLVDTKTFLASDSKAEDDGYSQYVNLPYARSYGMELMAEKRYSNYFSGKLSYSLMFARGYSGNADQGLNYFMWGFDVPNREYYLSWDQRHTVVGDVFIGRPGDWGVDLLWRFHSPRPYTHFPSRTGWVPDQEKQVEPNNGRMFHVSYLDIKAMKEFSWGENIGITVYLDARNVLDWKNVLWVASDGRIGGELGDPSAWDVGRRTNLGVRLCFGRESF